MSYRASKAAHRIFLKEFDGSNHWVSIKQGRGSAAAERYKTAGMHVTGFATEAGIVYIGDRGIDFGARRNILFQQTIIEWDLPGDDGGTLSCSPDEYDTLDDRLATWLEEQIESYYAQRQLSEEQLGNSNGSSTEPSAAVATSPVSSSPSPSLPY